MTEPINFSAMRLSAHRRDVIVASVMLQSGHELTRRANDSSPILFLGTWARPALAAAAVLAMVCGTMLTRTSATNLTPGAGIAEALGASVTTSDLVASQGTSVSELLAEETQ